MSDRATSQLPKPGSEHKRLEVFIGKWINEGHTVARPRAPAAKIVTSDIYEWATGGFFVLHTAYGIAGNVNGGGVEILSHDPASKNYRADFYDSYGNISPHELTRRDDT